MIGKLQLVPSGALTLAVLSAFLVGAARPVQAQTESVLYNFCSQPPCTDGLSPQSGLTFDGAGNLYGTTEYGGYLFPGVGDGNGTVFELSPNGAGGWNETVLYAFCSPGNCADGQFPIAPTLIFDKAGNLYGTTAIGGLGMYSRGVVFELSPVGGSWTESVLYSFCSQPNCADGSDPWGGLIMDSAGNLYGTTGYVGSVFELSPNGSGGWTEQVIAKNCILNQAGLAMDAAGNIFAVGCYTVFEVSPNGRGGWNQKGIHFFRGGSKDGKVPEGTPVLDNAGNLYGTTKSGGAKNYGTVWKLTQIKNGRYKGTWKETILHSFKGGPKDGASPWAGVVLDSAGNIYGTTVNGGMYGYANGGSGYGTVFELVAPVGKGGYKEKVLWNFKYTDGSQPVGGLILDSAGNLYGTTSNGGSSGGGVVFEVTP